jgi:hypothetical protein
LNAQRSKGDVLRYDPMTEEYGVLSTAGLIRTYFKPLPCIKLPIPMRAAVRMKGKCHPQTDNKEYFNAECNQH